MGCTRDSQSMANAVFKRTRNQQFEIKTHFYVKYEADKPGSNDNQPYRICFQCQVDKIVVK